MAKMFRGKYLPLPNQALVERIQRSSTPEQVQTGPTDNNVTV